MAHEAFVLHDTDGYHAYRHVGATHAQRIGPAWKTPRQAIDYAHALDAGRDISPLPSGEPVIAGSVAPLRVRGRSTGSPDGNDKAVNPASPTPGQ